MDKKILILFFGIFFFSIISALPIYVSPLSNGQIIPSSNINYVFNFTNNSDCSNVIISFQSSITTNKYGVGFVDLNISTITDIPEYLCEYRSNELRKVHTLSDQTFRDVYARNGNFSANVSADYFIGDGSRLTSISIINTSYYLATNPFSFYNTTNIPDFLLTSEWNATNTSYRTLDNLTFVGGNSSFDTNVLFVDAVNDRVGIGTISPTDVLHINATGNNLLRVSSETGYAGFNIRKG
ncbi:MAG: hypothetical protein AABY22_30415, partial [Nanoarchaeota archaeon]